MISGHAHQHGHGHSRFGNGLPIAKTSQKQWYHHRKHVHIYIYNPSSKQIQTASSCQTMLHHFFSSKHPNKQLSAIALKRGNSPRDQFRWCPSDSLLHVGRCVGSLAAAKWTKGRRCQAPKRPGRWDVVGRWFEPSENHRIFIGFLGLS